VAEGLGVSLDYRRASKVALFEGKKVYAYSFFFLASRRVRLKNLVRTPPIVQCHETR
jgi:hypothetical protein